MYATPRPVSEKPWLLIDVLQTYIKILLMCVFPLLETDLSYCKLSDYTYRKREVILTLKTHEDVFKT